MIGARISTILNQRKLRNAIQLCKMSPKTQDTAHMNVIREGHQKFLKFAIVSISLQILFLCVARHLSKLNRVIFNNLVKRI